MTHTKHPFTRREFLQSTAKGAAGFFLFPLAGGSISSAFPSVVSKSKVVIVKDDTLLDEGVIVGDVLQAMLNAGIQKLTGQSDPAEGWKSLFPGITRSSTIAIKVNTINSWVPTRPEVAYAIADSLHDMQVEGSDFPMDRIIIFDRTSNELTSAGYTINKSELGVKCYGTDGDYSNLAYDVDGVSTRMSRIVTDADYLINLPVLKNHTMAGVTLSMKNHYGTCQSPGALHLNNCNPKIPALNALPLIRDKQVVNICDAIWGINAGGPGGAPQIEPKSLIFSKDTVALDTIGAQMMDEHGGCATLHLAIHLATAAQSPYNLGNNNPDDIEVITIDGAWSGIEDDEFAESPSGFELHQNYPNPFNGETLIPYKVRHGGRFQLSLYNVRGRLIQKLVDSYHQSGQYKIRWDGKSMEGRSVPSGIYIGKLVTNSGSQAIQLQLLR